MKTLYKDLVEQTHTFPQEEFRVQDGNLKFHEIDLIDLVQRHGSPLKITYLPRISEQIHKTRTWFADAMQKTNYQGQYSFAYCTKSSHFSFILEECLKNEVDLETLSLNIENKLKYLSFRDTVKEIVDETKLPRKVVYNQAIKFKK